MNKSNQIFQKIKSVYKRYTDLLPFGEKYDDIISTTPSKDVELWLDLFKHMKDTGIDLNLLFSERDYYECQSLTIPCASYEDALKNMQKIEPIRAIKEFSYDKETNEQTLVFYNYDYNFTG